MPTLTLNYTFDTDLQGLVPLTTGGIGITAAWLGSDGSPNVGCLSSSGTVNGSGFCGAVGPLGSTWQSLGIPSGATVTSVQATAAQVKKASGPGNVGSTWALATVMDDSDSIILGSNGGINPTWMYTKNYNIGGAATAWATPILQGPTPVPAGSQPAASNARIFIGAFTSSGSQGVYDVRNDTVTIVITYTPGATAAPRPQAMQF